jgi:hypothetical protein
MTDKAAEKAAAAADTKKQEHVSSLEGEDEFEEFAAEGPCLADHL